MNDVGSKIFYALLIAGVAWFVNAAYCGDSDEPQGESQEEAREKREAGLRATLAEPGRREEVETLLAGATKTSDSANAAFLKGLRDQPTLQSCAGVVTAQDIEKSMTLPKEAVRRPFEAVGYVRMEVLITSGMKESTKLTPSRRQGPGELLPVSFVRQSSIEDGSARSRGIRDYAEAVEAARTQVADDMYPARDGWQGIPDEELVLLLEHLSMPSVDGKQEFRIGTDPFTRSGKGGEAMGIAAVWSHERGEWLCAGRFAAGSSETVNTLSFPPNFQEVPPEEASRLALLYSVFVDFSSNISGAVITGLGV